MIRISYQFATPEEAIAFLAKANNITHLSREIVAPEEVATPPAPPKRRAKAPVSAPDVERSIKSAVVEAVADKVDAQIMAQVKAAPKPRDTSEDTVAITPEQIKAALKTPNAPVQAVAAVGADEVRAALREVFNSPGGAKAAADVLKEFGATRISDVTPDKYAAFIKACKR